MLKYSLTIQNTLQTGSIIYCEEILVKKISWEKIKTHVFPFYNGSHHRAEHVMRVIANAIKIYRGELLDALSTKVKVGNCVNELLCNHLEKEDQHTINKLIAACALHDICRPFEKLDHAAEGAIVAGDLLDALFSDIFSENDILEICEAIRTHRYSRKLKATSIIGEILQDADRLDAIGPLGIARCFEYSVKNNIIIDGITDDGSDSAFQHLEKKCAKLTPDTFNTTTAGHIAESFNEYITTFISLYRSQQGTDTDILNYTDK